MKGHKIPQERRAKIVASLRERYAKMTPEERKATAARLNTPEIRASRHEQMLRRWEKCTGADRARACAHITNPEAQAKSHEAQRTPEFRARRSAWAKAAWAGLTPEERKEKARKMREVSELKRRGLPVPPRKKPSAAVRDAQLENLRKGREALKLHRAERALWAARGVLPTKPKLTPEERTARRLAGIEAYWVKYRAEHPKPPPRPKKRKRRRRQRTTEEMFIARSRAHRKPVIGTPKKDGEVLRFDSAMNAAQGLKARGLTKNALGAQQKISLVCKGHRKSAFGYIWQFAPRPHSPRATHNFHK